jgi:hypothetical protein
MNTNGLAKLYDRLTPKERLPLIMEAWAREDEAERNRLSLSAPRRSFRLPDYYWLLEGMSHVAFFHLLETLDVAAIYWQANGLLEQEEALGKEADKALRDQLDGLTRMFAYHFLLNIDGWRLFCTQHNYDPDYLWKGLPGYETVRQTEEEARITTFTAEEATAWMRRRGEETAKGLTAEAVAVWLTAYRDRWAKNWD